MTQSEAKGFVQGKLDCMKKCDIFNKDDNISDNDCDNCEYCYSQGNFGEQKEAFQIAINALEKQEKIKEIIANANQWSKEDVVVNSQAYCDIEKILRSDEEMSDLIEKIFEKFREEYGSDAKLEDGETQVFELQDCTVILALNDGELGVNVTADKPIKCDFASGLFVTETEERK